MLSANSANLIKSVFVAKGYTIKTFFEVITQSNLFSPAKSKIEERIVNQNPFSPPLQIVAGNEQINICSVTTSSFNCAAISTMLKKSKEILSVEILFCIPNNVNNATKFEPSVSLTYKLESSTFHAIPFEISSLIKLFDDNSIKPKKLSDNYPINYNNLSYDTIMLLLNAHKKAQITKQLASALTERRKEKGYTQSQLAELSKSFLNATDSPLNSLTISRIETQKINTIEIEKLHLLERTLQLPHGYFENVNNTAKNSPEKPKAVIIPGERRGNTTSTTQNATQATGASQEMHLSIAYCTQCGTKILRAGDKFCSRCGAQLPIEEAGASVSVFIKQENTLSRQVNQGRSTPQIQMAPQSLSMPRKKGFTPREKGKSSLRKAYKF